MIINNSQVTGGTKTICNDAEFTTYIGASLLDRGPVLANGGTLTCAGVNDEAYTLLCQHVPVAGAGAETEIGNETNILITCCALLLLAALLAASPSPAVVADGYDLSWNARFPGGASSGGGYTMNSAIGQPFAGVVANPGYSLCAGFLCGAEAKTLLYLPLVSK